MKIIISILVILVGLFSSLNLFGQTETSKLVITHLTGDFYVCTTYKSFNGKPMPSNSMYLVTDNGVVIFDTPWDSTQFQPLLDSIEVKHDKEVVMCIATHSHEDRTGGFGFLKEIGVKTYTSKQTRDISKQYNDKLADFYFDKDTTFTVGQYSFSTYYGGEGHTKDNIVLWFEDDRILYGGCLVKSVETDNLGYTGEANLEEWSKTIKNIKRKFSRPKYIITGHQDWSSIQSLNHTLKLLKQQKNKVGTTANPKK